MEQISRSNTELLNRNFRVSWLAYFRSDIKFAHCTSIHLFSSQVYCDAILQEYGGLFRDTVRPELYINNNADPYQTGGGGVRQLSGKDVERMNLLVCFSNLNPLEHAWDALEG